MATVNLGSIKFKWKGTYNGGSSYTIDDVVEYNGSSYICKLASTGNLPTNTTYFDVMSQAGTNGTNGTDVGTVITTQGDLVYRDGSGLQRLAKGSANQLLRINSGATAPEWATVAGGAFGQIAYAEDSTTYSNTSQSNYVRATNTKIDITPSASGKEILVMFNLALHFTYTDQGFEHRIIRIVGGSETILRTSGNIWEYNHLSGNGNWNRYSQSTLFIKDAPNTTSQVTYTIEFKNPHNTQTLDLNEATGELSQIMALEIN